MEEFKIDEVSVEPKKVKKPRKTTPIAIYPEIPTRIVSIDLQYIKDYFKGEFEAGRITRKEIGEWADKYKDIVAAKGANGAVKYFQEFRGEFIKKYFPELEERRYAKEKKESLGDFLEGLL